MPKVIPQTQRKRKTSQYIIREEVLGDICIVLQRKIIKPKQPFKQVWLIILRKLIYNTMKID